MAARKDKTARDRELIAKRRSQFLAVLDKLGVRKDFERLPLTLRNRLYLLRRRPPEIRLDPLATATSSGAALKQDIEHLLNYPLIDVLGREQRLSFNEVWWVVLTIWAALGPLGNPTGLVAEVASTMGPLVDNDAMIDLFVRIDKDIEMRAMMLCIHHSRIDHRVYGAELQQRKSTDPRDATKEVRVYAEEPRRRIFHVDGSSRPAYQVGTGIPHARVIWVEWDPVSLNRKPGPPLPVFVQGHAIERMMERMPGERSEEKRAAMHMMLNGALFKPEIVQRDNSGAYWVSLRGFRQERLGYLLAEVVDNAVLVKTFQFLTMHGSPEAVRLYRRLGARRADFEYLKLDQMATFVETDLEKDTELHEIFEACGCGHLFELRKGMNWPETADNGTAAWIKGYLDRGPKRPNGRAA